MLNTQITIAEIINNNAPRVEEVIDIRVIDPTKMQWMYSVEV
jgi:hypothetical protein